MTFHSPLKPARPPKGSSCYVIAPRETNASDCVWHLVELGYKVSGPNEHGDIRNGIRAVTEVDFVVLVPGYEFSRAANIEVTVARALKLPLLDCGTLDIVWQP